MKHAILRTLVVLIFLLNFSFSVISQIGTRFPSERKVIKDPVTGNELVFLTSQAGMGDGKIYQTHNQWTSDGQWLIFRSKRVRGEAMAVHEKTGVMVQVTEGGYTGMLNVARKSMKLYFMRNVLTPAEKKLFNIGKNNLSKSKTRLSEYNPFADSLLANGMNPDKMSEDSIRTYVHDKGWEQPSRSLQVIEVDLAKLFADSESGKLKDVSNYQRVCGTTPPEIGAGGDMALDGEEDVVYFRVSRKEAAKYLPEGTVMEKNFGPRNMGAGPSGLASMNIFTGEIKHVISVPFQVGHIQTNPWVRGEIVFCWETGGKSPQRTWIVNADGTGLRPLYVESDYEWVTHEAVIGRDEVAFAIMGHRKINMETSSIIKKSDPTNPGQENGWGNSGTREKPTGLGIVNIRTHEAYIVGQTDSGSGLWHVSGSSDGRWAVGDDFARNIYLIDRKSHEMRLLSTGHKITAADHPHPTFSPDGTKIQIQSAMLSGDNKSLNICIIPVPKEWLNSDK